MIDIDLQTLEEFSAPTKETDRYFIYFLIYEEQVVYIGQTVNLKARLLAHLTDKLYTSYKYIELDETDNKVVLRIEKKFITKYKPLYNNSTIATYKTNDLYFDRNTATLLTKDRPYLFKGKLNSNGPFSIMIYTGGCFYILDFDKRGNICSGVKDNVCYNYLDKQILLNIYKEVQHLLPENVTKASEQRLQKLVFIKGKYKGYPYSQVCKKDKNYINWMVKTVPDYKDVMLTYT